jgi:hypothetical protein
VKRKSNDGHRRRLPKEAMLARDAQIWAMHLRGMSDTEIADELGLPRSTAQRSIERGEKLHADDGSLEHLQACLDNPATGEPEDDPLKTPEQNGRVWDRWTQSLTVEDVQRIAQTPHPQLLLYRLRSHVPDLPPDVRRAINVAWKSRQLPSATASRIGSSRWTSSSGSSCNP